MTLRASPGALQAVEPPRIGVVVFCFNFERFIGECLQSLLDQTLRPHEIIVCDDCSTDGSWEVVSRFAEQHPDVIRAYRHPENIGLAKNSWFGLDQATCELMSLLDGDDRWLPGKLEAEWKALQANPSARIAYSNVREINAEGVPGRCWGDGGTPPSGDLFANVFAKRLFASTRSVYRNQLMYTDALRSVGYGEDEIEVHIDWDLKIRLAAAHPIVYTGETNVDYRIHGGGIHHARASGLYESTVKVIEKNLPLLKTRPAAEVSFVLQNLNELLRQMVSRQQGEARQFSQRDVDSAGV